MNQKYLDAAEACLKQIELMKGAGPALEGEDRTDVIMVLATVIQTIKELN